MPEDAAAFQGANVVGACHGAPRELPKQQQNDHADDHVQEMDAREDKVIHEEVVTHQRVPGTDLFAVLDDLDDAKTEATGKSEQEPLRCRGHRVFARHVHAFGDEPGTGQQ